MLSKRDVIRIRLAPKKYEEVLKQILEGTLAETYTKFKAEHPEIKVGQRSFEMRKPQQVISGKANNRLVCGCIYHFRVEYLLKAINTTRVKSVRQRDLFYI